MNDGQIYIRVATVHDREKLSGMFARSSSQTTYRRFHLPYQEVPDGVLSPMLPTGYGDKEVLVAVSEERIVGRAMYVRLGDDVEAEVALIVEDGWQSKGVGSSLLLDLAQRARPRGIETFTGEVLGQNQPMLGLAAVFLGTDFTTEEGLYHVRMPLRLPDPAVELHSVRRAA
jgi:GNAT superfamily N-acetyltransferase